MAVTLRINVLNTDPLDGATLLPSPIIAPATDVQRPDLGLREITLPVGQQFGRLDLGALLGQQSSWAVRHLAVESEVGATFTHLVGSEIRLRGPALPDATDGVERLLVALDDANFDQGIMPEGLNEPVPVGHYLIFDTAADGAGTGPHVIQITLQQVGVVPDRVPSS